MAEREFEPSRLGPEPTFLATGVSGRSRNSRSPQLEIQVGHLLGSVRGKMERWGAVLGCESHVCTRQRMVATKLSDVAKVEKSGLFYLLSASVYKTFQTFKKMLQNMKEKCQYKNCNGDIFKCLHNTLSANYMQSGLVPIYLQTLELTWKGMHFFCLGWCGGNSQTEVRRRTKASKWPREEMWRGINWWKLQARTKELHAQGTVHAAVPWIFVRTLGTVVPIVWVRRMRFRIRLPVICLIP